MKLPNAYARLLKTRSFSLFLANCGLGALGQGLTYISISWLSQDGGASLKAMALVMLGFWSPSIILALPVGAFIDRGNERMAAILSNLMRGILLIGVSLLSTSMTFSSFQLFLLALALGSFNAFYGPAIGVLIRKIVDQDDLLYANSLGDGLVEFFCIFGMGISGIVLNALGQKATLLIAGLFFVGAGLCFVFIKSHSHGENKARAELGVERLTWNIVKTPRLVATYTMSGILFFLMMATPVLLAPFVKSMDHASLVDFSLLEACFSIGAVIGALVVPYFASRHRNISLSIFWSVLALAFIYFAYSPYSLLWHLTYIIMGSCISTWAVVHTELQTITKIQFQGRLLAYNNAIWGSLVFLTFFVTHAFFGIEVIRGLYVTFAMLALLLIVIMRTSSWRALKTISE